MSQISCMSFNILAWDTNRRGFDKNYVRFPLVVETIRDEDPDLIGIQEAQQYKCFLSSDFEWCQKLIDAMDELGYAHCAIKDDKGFIHGRQNICCGLIIFYKKDRFTLKDRGAFFYPHSNYRYFQWVKLYDNKFERQVLFTNTHLSIDPKVGDSKLPALGNAHRTTEAGYLLDFWRKNCSDGCALFATGDYNSYHTSTPHEILKALHFKPSAEVAEIPDVNGTMNGMIWPYALDYCYINTKAQNVLQYKVVIRRFETGTDAKLWGFPSDHRPIMTYCDYK